MTAKDRPLRADALRNRTHLLGVARQVFADEGLEVPIDEVAKRAGLGIGTVYRHFPTKEALFEAIVVAQLDELLEDSVALQKEGDPERVLIAFLEKYMAAGAAKRDFMLALARGREGPQPPPAIGQAFKDLRAVVNKLLTRAQKAGAIRSDVGVEETLSLLHGVSAAPVASRPLMWSVVLDGLRHKT